MPDDKKIDYPEFVIRNNREICYNHKVKDVCGAPGYCHWINSKNMCVLNVSQHLFIDFVNKVTEEFVQNDLKAQEMLLKDKYFVSDIVNYNVYTERPGERIIMSSNTNIDKILSEIFGKGTIPRIGKRRFKLDSKQDYEQLNINNPLKKIDDLHIQTIIHNNNTIFRAFTNSYFWLKHPYNDITYRNLGYYSSLQTNLSNYYKSQVVDWLTVRENQDTIQPLADHIKYGNKISEFAIELSNNTNTFTNCLIELYVISILYYVMFVIMDYNFNVIYVITPTNGIVYDHTTAKGAYEEKTESIPILKFRFHYAAKSSIPDKIEAVYE